MSTEEINAKLKKCIISGNKDGLVQAVEEGLSENVSPMDLIDQMTDVMKEVGERFESGEAFLPEMIKAAEAWKVAVANLEPKLAEGQVAQKKVGRIVMGTVQGDMHDLGKNIVIMMLRGNGWEVTDLGVDISPEEFCEAVEKGDFQVLGMSALLTMTMTNAARTIEALKAAGLRDKVKVMVGGAPTTPDWAEKIGANAHAKDGPSAAKKAAALAVLLHSEIGKRLYEERGYFLAEDMIPAVSTACSW